MSRWFRHYAGMMSDPKFGGVARFCKRSRAEVLFVYGCLLESCAEYDSAVYSWDADAVAELLGIDTEVAEAVHDALVTKGLLADGRLLSWDKRQFKSDDSSERVKAHRQRQKEAAKQPPNANETACNGDVTPPDTETETDTTTVAKAPVVVARQVAPKTTKAVRSRRCPNAWMPSETDIAFAKREGFTAGEIDRELAKIRDYEFRDPHSDWGGVFRNWIRKAAERKPNQGPRHERPDRPSAKRLARDDNHARALAGFEAAARMRTVGR